MDLQNFFERVMVVSLARREDRYAAFRERIAACGWPFRQPDRFLAIDGKLVPHPPWFGDARMNGAWGAYRSFQAIIEWALNDRIGSLLVLEDDALPVDGFGDKAQRFLEAVPPTWQMLYLGAQSNHYDLRRHPDRIINTEVVVPWSVNRLHAFGLTAAGMKILYRHIASHDWQTGHQIDHHIERLHRSRAIEYYCPPTDRWLIGQAPGVSDICGRDLPVRFFNTNRAPNQSLPTVIAVLGPYRGGTSAVAGAMHYLGISMGNQFFAGNREATPKGCFEAKRLFDICNACYPEPKFKPGRPYPNRVQLLRGWLAGRRNEEAVIGAKHPKLCLMVPEMLESWPDCKFVVVHRPIRESTDSLAKFGWFSSVWKPEDLIGMLVKTRDEEIAKLTPGPNPQNAAATERVFHLDFAHFLDHTRDDLQSIAEFAGIEPLPEQYQKALEQVDKGFKHFNASEKNP